MSDIVSEARPPVIEGAGGAIPADADAALLEKLIRYSDLVPPLPPGVAARMAGVAADDWEDAAPADDASAPLPQPIWAPLAAEAAADRALGCLLGLALGEAAVREAGQAVVAAARCLADTVRSFGGFDEEDFLIRLAALPAAAKAGLDPATKAVLDAYEAAETDAAADDADDGAGPDGPDDAAALARLAPVAIAARGEPDVLDVIAVRQTRLSHPGVESVDASSLFAAILADALTGADLAGATRPRVMALCPQVLFISAGEWKNKARGELGQGPGVVATLETALWCVGQSASTEEAVRLAMGFAGSPLAAVLAGQFGGALHGAAAMQVQDPSVERWELGLVAADLMGWTSQR